MKHISSKIVLLTILLVTTLIVFNAAFSVGILKNESRTYTFQNQQLQTQGLSNKFELEFYWAQEIATTVFSSHTSKERLVTLLERSLDQTRQFTSGVKGVAVFTKGDGRWYETKGSDISKNSGRNDDWFRSAKETFVLGDPAQIENHIAVFPSKDSVILVKVNLEKVKDSCNGLSVAVFNNDGSPILYCDSSIAEWLNRFPNSVKEALTTDFQSGSFEREEGDQAGLWAFSKLSSFGRVVSFTDVNVAYRPAYLLGIKILLMALMLIAVAMIASLWVSRKVAGPITIVTDATLKISEGEFDTEIKVNTNDETRVLADAVKTMAVKIKQLISVQIEKTKLESQLEVAGAVQRIFIPENKIKVGNLTINSYYKPATLCGGDWWSYIASRDEVAILYGDVTGHGFASALLVGAVRGALSIIQEKASMDFEMKLNPVELLSSLNAMMLDSTHSEMQMTAACFIVNLKTGEYRYSSAGQNSIYFLDSEKKNWKPLLARGVRIGDVRNIQSQLDLNEGKLILGKEKVVFFTDGIFDLGDEQHTLGRKGFRAFLDEKTNSTGEQLVDSVVNELIPLNAGKPLEDDITFLVLE